MPIRPEQRALYPKDWVEVSARVRERAGNRCETCKVANGALISRGLPDTGDAGRFMTFDGDVFDAETGEPLGSARGSEWEGAPGIKVVLTVAHLDHDPTNNAPSNLRALCQMHHLRHDAKQHANIARETRRRRKAAGNLPGIG